MNDDLLDRDGLLEPMTKKPRYVRLREVKEQLSSEAEKRKRDALLLAAVEIMRQVR